MSTLLEIPGLVIPSTEPRAAQDVGWWVISWGLGVDSTAILLRLCELLDEIAAGTRQSLDEAGSGAEVQPAFSADFDLDRLVVVTAMTGSEWPIHRTLAERFVLPRLARHGIRFVQVARSGPRKADGISILSDSRAPTELHMGGDYRLFDEMVTAGTIPQLGGARKCSQKAKGVPADEAIALVTGGGPYRQIMGYEVGESSRCAKDTGANTPNRIGVYPLVTWGWTREMCEIFIHSRTGVWWPKSACTFCVYSLANRAGRDRVLAGFAAEPALAWESLLMETVAQGLNPSQTLMASEALYDLMERTPGQEEALRMFDARVEAGRWALVEVQRAVTGPGRATRKLTVHGEGSRDECSRLLIEAARRIGERVERAGRHSRLWLERRTAGVFPTAEHFLVVVPATVKSKTGPGFERAWLRATTATALPSDLQGVLELAG